MRSVLPGEKFDLGMGEVGAALVSLAGKLDAARWVVAESFVSDGDVEDPVQDSRDSDDTGSASAFGFDLVVGAVPSISFPIHAWMSLWRIRRTGTSPQRGSAHTRQAPSSGAHEDGFRCTCAASHAGPSCPTVMRASSGET